MYHLIAIGLLCLLIVLIVFVAVEALIIRINGKPPVVPNMPRDTQRLGTGKALSYVIMGDSTTIGQGTTYDKSYAWLTAQHLAKDYCVSQTNLGVSGARAKDVLQSQLGKVKRLSPDIVLLSVGANDVTHLTSSSRVQASLQGIIDGLRQINPAVKIIVTGSPQMGTVPRLPWPARQLATQRTARINTVYALLCSDPDLSRTLYFAPIAAKTGPAFAKDRGLFAEDKFHPNARGYALWAPVINRAIDAALHE